MPLRFTRAFWTHFACSSACSIAFWMLLVAWMVDGFVDILVFAILTHLVWAGIVNAIALVFVFTTQTGREWYRFATQLNQEFGI